MKKIAFIFPGQGSQSTGMGLDLYNNYESAKKVYDVADKTLGKDISAWLRFCISLLPGKS